MKENSIKNERSSIEEDIKILEKKIEDYKPYKNIEYCSHAGQILQEEYKALEHILSDYKRVLKENEELKNQEETARKVNELLVERYSTSIPVQKVKDKIEELNQYYKKEIYPSLYQWADITITEHYDEMIELLQELLEEGGENG